MQKIPMKLSIANLLFYIFGIIFTALGVVLLLRGNLGVSPWDTLNYSLSEVTPLLYGDANFIISSSFVLFVTIVEKKWKYIFILVPIFLVTRLINLFNANLFLGAEYQTAVFNYLFFATGLFTLALGGSFMVISSFPAGIYEELMLTLMRIFKTDKLALTRVIMEVCVVLAAFIIGAFAGFWFGKINLGTIVISLSFGPILNIILKTLKKLRTKKQLKI
ncbi:DUF6198 family protein [Mycoplasmatota bacterium WC30]